MKSHVSLNICILPLLLGNGSQALHANPRCLKRISGMNLPSANKNLFNISFIDVLIPSKQNIVE